MYNKPLLYLTLLALPGVLIGQTNPTYRFATNVGNIDVTLTPSVAPATVANFLSYVNSGAYNNTIFHRSVPGFVIQGGGFQYQGGSVITTATTAPVTNEFNVSNTTGTIAMAKLSGSPNSATSQWFFNLANNGTNGNALDSTNGGYTVFGKVANAASLAVMNKIATVPVYDCSGDGGVCPLSSTNSAFTNLPLSSGNYVLVTSIQQINLLSISGITSSASFASNSLTGVSPGEILAIFGSGMGPDTAVLGAATGGAFPTTLGGVQVMFNGTAAPLYYVSSGQINVIAPSGFSILPSVDIVVTYNGMTSTIQILPVRPANPALFTQNYGSGDAAAVKLDGSLVNASNPAAVGDVVLLFGEGYGLATPATALPDGAIVPAAGPYPVPNDPTTLLLIDGQTVPTSYFGGAPTLVNGVLQVNFTVPKLSPGSHQIQLQVGSRTSPTGVTLQTK
jgi:uncharacterized protein (TIGR03437 family)